MPYFRAIFWTLIVLLCVGVFFGVLHSKKSSTQPTNPGSSVIGGPFRLKDIQGKMITSADFRGKYLLVYFGYSYCPDICPAALSNMTEALKQMGYKRDAIQPLFITVDPERDTPEELKSYMANFDPKFVALTGTPDEIEAAKKAYRVYANKVSPEQAGTTDYLVDHTSLIYLMAPNGSLATYFNHETSAADIVKTLNQTIR